MIQHVIKRSNQSYRLCCLYKTFIVSEYVQTLRCKIVNVLWFKGSSNVYTDIGTINMIE